MIRQIGRRIATDKMIVCLLLVVLLAILALIVLKVVLPARTCSACHLVSSCSPAASPPFSGITLPLLACLRQKQCLSSL